MGFREGGLGDQSRLWNRVVVQARNVPEGEGQVGCGLTVWRVEGAVLGGVLIALNLYVEGFLDGGDGASDDHVHAVAATADE